MFRKCRNRECRWGKKNSRNHLAVFYSKINEIDWVDFIKPLNLTSPPFSGIESHAWNVCLCFIGWDGLCVFVVVVEMLVGALWNENVVHSCISCILQFIVCFRTIRAFSNGRAHLICGRCQIGPIGIRTLINCQANGMYKSITSKSQALYYTIYTYYSIYVYILHCVKSLTPTLKNDSQSSSDEGLKHRAIISKRIWYNNLACPRLQGASCCVMCINNASCNAY